jgi:hypothetical protein
MGLIHVTVSLRALHKSRKKYEADFLVDTGATDCLAPDQSSGVPAFNQLAE